MLDFFVESGENAQLGG